MGSQSWEQEVETFGEYDRYQLLKQILAELKKQTEYLSGIYDNTPAD